VKRRTGEWGGEGRVRISTFSGMEGMK